MSHDHAATKALPDDLLAYMRSHIKAKRDDLDGFLAIGNEVNRVATYDRWLAALADPAAPVAQPYLHVYEYDTPFGLHREFYPRPYNGKKPTRTVALYDAPQPVSEPSDVSDADIRRVFLANGFTIKEGHDDLKPYVYAAARAVLALRPAPQPVSEPAAPRAPLTDEQIDRATSAERDELLDHIYEYGTASEGVMRLVRKLARRAYGIGQEGAA